MEIVKIKDKDYRLVVDYKNDEPLRSSLNSLTQKTYKFDFEDWYQNGYWKDRYIPYSLVAGASIVSNVSVNIIDFLVAGIKRTCVQIGTVMTDSAYRNQGLNRILMNKVLEDWRDRSDLTYLFANDTVLDFYPKFGFTAVNEYQHSLETESVNPEPDFIKLDMSDAEDKEFLINKINQSIHISEISMVNNASLIMFYCTTFMNQNVYYLKKHDAVVIAEFNDGILFLNDVFSAKEISFDEIMVSLMNKNVKKVVMGFTPKNKARFDEEPLRQGDTLFILNDKWGLFKNKKYRFPLLSRA